MDRRKRTDVPQHRLVAFHFRLFNHPWSPMRSLFCRERCIWNSGRAFSATQRIHGVNEGLIFSAIGGGYGIQCSCLVCASSEDFKGLSLAPVNICLGEKNNNMQIGFISLACPYRRNIGRPPLGQLSLINYTDTDCIRLGFHFQGGLWNRECYAGWTADYSGNLSEQSERPGCPDEGEDRMGHLLQVGLLNEADYVGSHTQLGLVNLNEGYGDSSYTQLGLVNWDDSCIWDDNCIACDSFKIQCGLVNCRRGTGFEDRFGLQIGLVNYSLVDSKNDRDRTMQIGLVNIKRTRWTLLFNW